MKHPQPGSWLSMLALVHVLYVYKSSRAVLATRFRCLHSYSRSYTQLHIMATTSDSRPTSSPDSARDPEKADDVTHNEAASAVGSPVVKGLDEDEEFTPAEQRKIIHRIDRRLISTTGIMVSSAPTGLSCAEKLALSPQTFIWPIVRWLPCSHHIFVQLLQNHSNQTPVLHLAHGSNQFVCCSHCRNAGRP